MKVAIHASVVDEPNIRIQVLVGTSKVIQLQINDMTAIWLKLAIFYGEGHFAPPGLVHCDLYMLLRWPNNTTYGGRQSTGAFIIV